MTIIPEVRRPTTNPTHSNETDFAGNLAVSAGQVHYYRGEDIRFYWADHDQVIDIVNAGTIWAYSSSNVSAAVAGFYIDRVINSGTIAAEIDTSTHQANAFALSILAAGRLVDNSGTIYASTRGGQALALDHWGGATIINSGLIAAWSAADGQVSSSSAVGIRAVNGGMLHNQADGEILAEGMNATAVSFGRGRLPFEHDGPEILNDGRIEAATHPGGNPSVGIVAAHLGVEHMQIVNNGLIRADVAIRGGSATWPYSAADEVVENSATGRIFGDIELNLGDDRLVNAGQWTGNFFGGEGNDRFDTRAGAWTGFADMGWGNDEFLGSAGNDRVVGGRGADQLSGGDGNDLLVGGVGNDRIVGGTGNDGLYGEYDDDLLITSGGDKVYGGTGNDRIELGDLGFALIDGEGGKDRLVLPGVAGTVDIMSIVNSGRVLSIEEVELVAGRAATIAAGDFGPLNNLLQIFGAPGSDLVLTGNWTFVSERDFDGTLFAGYSAGNGRVLWVQAGVDVTIASAVPVDRVGMQPVGGGAAAPDLASDPDLDPSSNLLLNPSYSVTSDLVIDRDEIWRSNDQNAIIYSSASESTVTNYGRLERADHNPNFGSRALEIGSLALFANYGTVAVQVTGSGAAYGINGNNSVALANFGTISASVESGYARAVTAGESYSHVGDDFLNMGTISAFSGNGDAFGAYYTGSQDSTGRNGGLIEARGTGLVFGLYVTGVAQFENTGQVYASLASSPGASSRVVALYFESSYLNDTLFTNRGAVAGPVAIEVSTARSGGDFHLNNFAGGDIAGEVRLDGGNDTIFNQGRIIGTIDLGSGNDRFENAGGTQQGGVIGGTGNDHFVVDGQSILLIERAGEGDDSVTASASYYLFDNIENLILSGSAGNFGVGNALANTIIGNAGSNLLLGGGGDDVVRGGGGVDSLFGESGADQLFGDAGVDYLVGGIGNDILDGGADADALYGEDGDDTLTGGTGFHTDILVGGIGNDILRGNSGLGDYDLMDGGAGNDGYYVDTPDDLTFEAAGGGTDTVYANINGAGYYLYANVENLILEGNTPFGVGNALANRLTGNAIGNYLLGGAGNDTLNGKGGNDVLFGEGGADTFVFERGTGGDVIGDFARGTDKIDLSAFGFASFAAVQANFSQVGANGAINLGNGDFIVLHNVTMSQLTQGDFILSPAAAKADPFAAAEKAFDGSGGAPGAEGPVLDWLPDNWMGLYKNTHDFAAL
jgi:Ca2+-binding RTX toxin-like protein